MYQVFLVLFFNLFLFFSCSNSSGIKTSGNPDGWTEATHGKTATPNYNAVFPQASVNRIDVSISSANWSIMSNDMFKLYGRFGGGSMAPPPPRNDKLGKNRPRVGDGSMAPPPPRNDKLGKNRPRIGDGSMAPPPPRNDKLGTNMQGFGGGSNPPPPRMEFSVENPVWVPCTFESGNNTWRKVGIRFKGNSSLKTSWEKGQLKLPFRLDFDQFEDTYPAIRDQRFYGFKKLTLSSGYNDDSLMREKVAADIFRAAGVPAPQTAFYRVYINYGQGAKYFGLYTMVEVPEKPMFDTQFKKHGGNLYKPDGGAAALGKFATDAFAKKSNKDKEDWSDIIALFTALHGERSVAARWRNNLQAVFNVNGFLRWLAVNTVIQNWDSYGEMTHNYYLYHDTDNLIHWIPWDNNEALNANGPRAPLTLGLTEVPDSWPLIRYLMDDAEYYTTYTNYVAQVVTNAFQPAKVKARYLAAYNLIKDYVSGADGESGIYTLLSSATAFEAGFDYLNSHVDARYTAVTNFINSQGR